MLKLKRTLNPQFSPRLKHNNWHLDYSPNFSLLSTFNLRGLSAYIFVPLSCAAHGEYTYIQRSYGDWRGDYGKIWPRSSSSSTNASTSASKTDIQTPATCTAGGHSSKELFEQLVTNYSELVMATLAKQKRTKASIMVFSSISKRSEHLR
jgi:hypothetical protein